MTPRLGPRAALGVALLVTLVGCGTGPDDRPPPHTGTPASMTFGPLPPPITSARLYTARVALLTPGAPIMLGEERTDPTRICQAGFAVTDGTHITRFLTAAQCAHGDPHAAVSVTRPAPGERTEEVGEHRIGVISYLRPGVPGAVDPPWSLPFSPVAVFGPQAGEWALPVATTVRGRPVPARDVQHPDEVFHRDATATWTSFSGTTVTGHILDPATTPELATMPATVQRVVVAADDPDADPPPVYTLILGSPVTVEIDGVTANLGVVTGTDPDRHWVVVDLLGPVLAERGLTLDRG